jgi:ubiquinone/menaquinone biosynthesis C-methylase UbiE
MHRVFHQSSHPAGHGRTIGNAHRYQWLTGLLFLGGRAAALQQLVEAVGIQPGDQVLDVGCGDGLLTALAAAAAGPTGAAVGVDAAPEMIGYAANSHPEATFVAGSATVLPFPDSHFDVVVCSLVLHHLEPASRVTAVGEMARVVKPGGRLLLAEFTVPTRRRWRLVAHLLGLASMGMVAPFLERLAGDAGFSSVVAGDVPPWLRYATGSRAG